MLPNLHQSKYTLDNNMFNTCTFILVCLLTFNLPNAIIMMHSFNFYSHCNQYWYLFDIVSFSQYTDCWNVCTTLSISYIYTLLAVVVTNKCLSDLLWILEFCSYMLYVNFSTCSMVLLLSRAYECMRGRYTHCENNYCNKRGVSICFIRSSFFVS